MKSISYISIKDCYIDKFISTNCSEEKQEEEEEVHRSFNISSIKVRLRKS